jgi:plastocyanin
MPHTWSSITGVWNSGTLLPKKSFSFTFKKPGTYHYECFIHPTKMMGSIIVT